MIGRDRAARLRVTRLRVVLAVTVLLGLVQILYEEVVLFFATTRGDLPGILSERAVAVGVPLTIAALLLVLLLGGALWTDEGGTPPRAPTDAEDDTDDDSES